MHTTVQQPSSASSAAADFDDDGDEMTASGQIPPATARAANKSHTRLHSHSDGDSEGSRARAASAAATANDTIHADSRSSSPPPPLSPSSALSAASSSSCTADAHTPQYTYTRSPTPMSSMMPATFASAPDVTALATGSAMSVPALVRQIHDEPKSRDTAFAYDPGYVHQFGASSHPAPSRELRSLPQALTIGIEDPSPAMMMRRTHTRADTAAPNAPLTSIKDTEPRSDDTVISWPNEAPQKTCAPPPPPMTLLPPTPHISSVTITIPIPVFFAPCTRLADQIGTFNDPSSSRVVRWFLLTLLISLLPLAGFLGVLAAACSILCGWIGTASLLRMRVERDQLRAFGDSSAPPTSTTTRLGLPSVIDARTPSASPCSAYDFALAETPTPAVRQQVSKLIGLDPWAQPQRRASITGPLCVAVQLDASPTYAEKACQSSPWGDDKGDATDEDTSADDTIPTRSPTAPTCAAPTHPHQRRVRSVSLPSESRSTATASSPCHHPLCHDRVVSWLDHEIRNALHAIVAMTEVIQTHLHSRATPSTSTMTTPIVTPTSPAAATATQRLAARDDEPHAPRVVMTSEGLASEPPAHSATDDTTECLSVIRESAASIQLVLVELQNVSVQSTAAASKLTPTRARLGHSVEVMPPIGSASPALAQEPGADAADSLIVTVHTQSTPIREVSLRFDSDADLPHSTQGAASERSSKLPSPALAPASSAPCCLLSSPVLTPSLSPWSHRENDTDLPPDSLLAAAGTSGVGLRDVHPLPISNPLLPTSMRRGAISVPTTPIHSARSLTNRRSTMTTATPNATMPASALAHALAEVINETSPTDDATMKSSESEARHQSLWPQSHPTAESSSSSGANLTTTVLPIAPTISLSATAPAYRPRSSRRKPAASRVGSDFEYRSCRVLVVDDSLINVKILSRMLHVDLGINVYTAFDGAQAVAAVQKLAAIRPHEEAATRTEQTIITPETATPAADADTRNVRQRSAGEHPPSPSSASSASSWHAKRHFDLILSDLNMPVMSGLESCRLIRSLESAHGLPKVPIVAVTANSSVEDRAACADAGMDYFLQKPLTKNDVLTLVQQILQTQAAASSSERRARDDDQLSTTTGTSDPAWKDASVADASSACLPPSPFARAHSSDVPTTWIGSPQETTHSTCEQADDATAESTHITPS